MEPKKAIIVKHKKLVVRLKKPIEPTPTKKPKRQSRKLTELLAQGKRYYRFVQNIALMDKWCQFVLSTGIKPNDRLHQLVEMDVKHFERNELTKVIDFGKTVEYYKNQENIRRGCPDFGNVCEND